MRANEVARLLIAAEFGFERAAAKLAALRRDARSLDLAIKAARRPVATPDQTDSFVASYLAADRYRIWASEEIARRSQARAQLAAEIEMARVHVARALARCGALRRMQLCP